METKLQANQILDLIEEGIDSGRYPEFGRGNFSDPGTYCETAEDDTLIYIIGQLWNLVEEGILPERELPMDTYSTFQQMEQDKWYPRIFHIKRLLQAARDMETFITADEYPVVHDVILQGIPFESKVEEARRNAVYFSVAMEQLFNRSAEFRTILGGVLDPHTIKYLKTLPDAYERYDKLRAEKWKPDYEIVEELALKTAELNNMNIQQAADFIMAMIADIYKQHITLRVV